VHLADGGFIKPLKAVCLRQTHVNEFCIHAFEVCQHEQLLNGGMVAHVAFEARIAVPPLLCGLSEQRDIEQICFTGVGDRDLRGGDGRRNQVRLNGVGMDTVIELGQGTVKIPGQRQPLVFVLLEALKLLDEIKLNSTEIQEANSKAMSLCA
jgi:hypothetical protein